jgi:hypothetical protein
MLDVQPTGFFTRTYDEALDLVEAARSRVRPSTRAFQARLRMKGICVEANKKRPSS